MITNFTVIDSYHGPFIVNRHCSFQAEALIKTARPHIHTELEKIRTIVRTLSDGCVVVDAGANIGLVSIPIARELIPLNGTVHAFEPQRMLAYALCGAVALNDLENVRVYNRALGAEADVRKAAKPDYGWAQDFGEFSLVNSDGPEDIPVMALDALGLPRLDFLKIDVEGMELEVIKGARETIHAWRPWCWVEYWKAGKENILQQFQGMNYQCYIMDELNMLCAPVERMEAAGMTIMQAADA